MARLGLADRARVPSVKVVSPSLGGTKVKLGAGKVTGVIGKAQRRYGGKK
jgi:hypothetical protein